MQEIRAAVCRAHGDPLTVETIRLREPRGREVEVAIAACAICHSDLTLLSGGWGGGLPTVAGHEAAGRVTALGPEARGLAVGDKVIVTLIRACGRCPMCASGRPVQCEERYDRMSGPVSLPDGTPVEHGINVAGFAEKAVVDISQVAKVPESMPFDAASLLSCGIITGLGAAVNTAGIRPGQTVVVIGAGGVGLAAIQGARLAGAARIVAVDRLEAKLDVAKEFGATDAILGEGAPWDRLREIAPRGADHVLVAVGVPAVYDTALNYLGRGGQVTAVGMPHDGTSSRYAPADIAGWGQGITGTKMGDTVLARDIPWICDLYGQGRIKLDEMISGRWSLDQINEAIADTASGAARRNVIVFEGVA
jgi:Zn-dependent alcohol dehydrogenase